jgi:hypothetical protein
MEESVRITQWGSLGYIQKIQAMELINERIPRVGQYTTVFLMKALDKRKNYAEREEDLALVALEEERVVGVIVARKDLRRKQLWIRFAVSKISKGTKEFAKKHKTTPVAAMIKRMIRRGEREKFEVMIDPPRTMAGKNLVAKRIQRILPKKKRIFKLPFRI